METHDKPVPSKWLPSDIVSPTDSSVSRKTLPPIVGVVDFLNRTGQGFSPRGVPLYLFHPYDPAWPPFLVSSKTKSDTNIVALVSYEHWDGGCAWPRGGILKRLGAVGDKAVERAALLSRAGVKEGSNNELVDCFADCLRHEKTDWDCVFNIDPEGCKDIDDVFAWRKVGGKTEFAIAIADVAAFVASGSDLDCAARMKGLSCYENGVPIQPMLPTELSEVRASLRADGSKRPTVAYVFTLKDGAVESVKWSLLSLAVQRAYSYESVLFDADISKKLPELLTICLGSPVGSDPHEWVAAAMIAYNKAVGELLKSAGLGLLRRHAGTVAATYRDLADRTGCAALAMLGMAAGEYCPAAASDCAHAGLGLAAYAHASSPLRRYADLVNQRWIKYLVFGGEAPSSVDDRRLCLDLNAAERRFKALERDLWFLSQVNPGTITEADGYLLEFKAGKWSVYVPGWRKKVRGVCAYELTPGMHVRIRAFADLRRPAWTERIVVQII